MCNGLPWVCQHLIPVVPAKAFSIDPHSANSYDLIVANSERETKVIALLIQNDLRKEGLVVVVVVGRLGLCLVYLT